MTGNTDAAEGDAASMSRRGFFRAGAAGAAVAAGVAAGSGTAAAQYDGWLEGVSNYDGTHDYRGQDEVTVSVGAGENGLRFGPAAILIDPGATVVWEWTGQGGGHNVVADDGTFDSGSPVSEEGTTFEYTFEDASDGDTFNYLCEPHRAVGMKGVVAVGSVDDDPVDPQAEGGSGSGGGSGGDGGDGGSGSGDSGGSDGGLSASDIGTLALGFGFAGALLVPLFYAAHKKAERNA
ncbi:halocyanin domain-containing protein [Halorubrum ezzemoulense]|uniref:Halocyanin domain-containing protein n=1 Tax=Halorubrum ezzemoulense TaxID=337243 RepID=A0A238UNN2_HALEZ|nr:MULTISPECIES: halocyanin domain-containing protein [Halorubrum]TKX38549.1 halocyanin domain-containing protein [Halorubrum sp. CGM4_25_10-8A]SNR22909.1 halocyanin domain-containing protein [Halorubrum ezzemoulense]